MKIKSVTIIKGYGADKILLLTDLPDACWPFTDNQTLEFIAAQNTGEAYLKKWFPLIKDIQIVERFVK